MNWYSKKDSSRARSGGTALTYLTVLLLAGAAHGQEAIGSATSITPQAEGSHGGKHTLATGGNVYHQDDIETGVGGIAGLRFHDNSDLKVGPSRALSSTSSSTIPTDRQAASPSKRPKVRFVSRLGRRRKVRIK